MMKLYSTLKSKKSLIIGLIVTAIFAIVARHFATYTINDSEIEHYEQEVKEQLPFNLGYIGSVTAVYNSTNEIVYVCEINEDYISIDKLRNNMRGTRQNCKLSLLCNTGRSNYLFNILNKYNKGIKVIYKGKNDSVEVCFSPEDVKKISENKIEAKKLAFEYMEKYVNEKNALCPIKLTDTLSLVGLKLDKSTFYYYHAIELDDSTMAAFDENTSILDFINKSKDPNIRSVGRKVAVAGLNVKLIYTSTKTGKQRVFPFSNRDLVNVLMDTTSSKNR